MTMPALLQAIQRARDQAKAILDTLEQAGHPQTSESSGLYLGLVTLQKRLTTRGTGATVGEFSTELEQLASLCTGKLAVLRPLLEEAARLARGGQGG
ncbi:MAG TPA: hypothetical protein VFU41_14945 [Gemmatimonadales bacterium]|nr:hypothetical protein [Gemmatimonadales bacterium]